MALQHTATRCNTLQRIEPHCNTLQHTATLCNTLQHNVIGNRLKTSMFCSEFRYAVYQYGTATHWNALQHTATRCNTLQQVTGIMSHYFSPCLHTQLIKMARQHTATHRNTLQHTATHCNTLQHTATHCNTLQQATGTMSHYFAPSLHLQRTSTLVCGRLATK